MSKARKLSKIPNQITRTDTIATLRLMTETPEDVYVTGYHTANDGTFGSHFFRLATDTGQVDNGGTIIRTVNGVYELQYGTEIDPKEFGASSTSSSTINRVAVQNAVQFCISNKINLKGSSFECPVDGTIYIQNSLNPVFLTGLERTILDFGGMSFIVDTGNTLFESATYSGGIYTSTIENVAGGVNSFNVTIQNFTISGGDYGVRLNNMHQGCLVKDITSYGTKTVCDLNHCFYTQVDNVTSYSSDVTWVDERFIFRGVCNLMKISRCVALNSAIGYKFSATDLTDVIFDNNSVEGTAIGIQIGATILNGMSITNNYFEANTDVYIKMTSSSRAMTIDGNFFAATGGYLFEFTVNPGKVLFGSNNNIVSILDNKMVKNGTNGITGSLTIDNGHIGTGTISTIEKNIQANYPYNTVSRGIMSFGLNEATAKLNTGICEGNYSGRMTKGSAGAPAKLYGCELVAYTATTAEYSTKIISQDRQLLFVAIKILHNSGGSFAYANGFIFGNVFYKFDVTNIAVATSLTVSTDVDGYVRLLVSGLTTPTATYGAEVRIL